jgi:hypothetical protein
MGGTRTPNGPEGAFAFGMEGSDRVQFGSAPSPARGLSSWFHWLSGGSQCGLRYRAGRTLLGIAPARGRLHRLRDRSHSRQVANELTGMTSYAGPRTTPNLLFRGCFPGETAGPYISQFLITPTLSASKS